MKELQLLWPLIAKQEVDFEGCAASAPSAMMSNRTSGSLSARAAATLASAANQCHLVFSGLDRTGVDLRSLTVTAHFGVDSVHKVTKVAGPIQVRQNSFRPCCCFLIQYACCGKMG